MSKKHLATSLLALALASASGLYGDTLDTGVFSKRVTVTFTGVQSGVTLTDFPALVKLSTAIEGFSYGDFKGSNGSDLRFADSAGNLIPHEIDTWNTAGVSTVWVKVPSLTKGATITAYYGSTATLPEVASKDVWDDGYVGVWHLGESAVPMRDSSGGSTNFAQTVGTGISFASAGVIGGAVDFGSSGNSRALKAPDHPALDGFSKCTFEMWTFITDRTSGSSSDKKNKGMLSKRIGYNSDISYYIHDNGSATLFYVSSSGSSSTLLSQAVVPDENAWTYQSYSFDGATGTVQGWKNGVSSGTGSTSVTSVFAGNADLYLGNFGVDERNFSGKIDEVRISNVARSSEWIKATYDTATSDSFATYEVGNVSPYGQIDTMAFSRKVDVTFSGYTGAELTNFPVLVKLSTAIEGFRYADFKRSGGGDLRFADSSGSLLPYEIDTWNPEGVSTVWVKVPLLTQNTTITAYYSSSATLPEIPASAVWDDGYVGVWHLGESALPMKDSTGVSTSFTSKTGTVVYAASGAVGGSVDFTTSYSSTQNYLVAPDNDNVDGFADLTFEVWTYQDSFRSDSQYAGIFSKRTGVVSQESYLIWQQNSSSAAYPVFSFNTSGVSGGRVQFQAASLPPTGQWTHQALVRNTGTGAAALYMNGASSKTGSAGTDSIFAGTAAMYLGCDRGQKTFPGKIDELRISKVARSEDWVKATYATVTSDSFATYAAGYAPGAAKIDYNDYAKQVEVTFSGYAGDELENFPVLVKLSTAIPGFSYSDFSFQNGGDLRFADIEGNILPHEIDTWDESGVSMVWVKVPSLLFGTKITACYGCTTPPPVDSKDVWDSNYLGVWHLGAAAGEKVQPDAMGTEHSFTITTNLYNGAPVADGVACGAKGIVGLAASTGRRSDLRGTFFYSDQDYHFSDKTAFTVEAWTWQDNHEPASSGRNRYIVAKTGGNEENYDWRLYETSTGRMALQIKGIGNTSEIVADASAAVPARNAWNHTAITWDGTSGDVGAYLGGEALELSSATKAQAWTGRMPTAVKGFNLGNHRYDIQKPFVGSIDEVRISKTARSAAWIKATHDTVVAENFATYEVKGYEPGGDDTPWYTNEVIACSVPDFSLVAGSSYEYVLTTNCTVRALTNLHFVAISQSTQTDLGYFQPGDMKNFSVAAGLTLGLTAEVVDPAAIPSAAITPMGSYIEERDGAYTIYTFTGAGAVTVNRPGVADVTIIGPKGGETVTLRRLILNEATSIIVGESLASFGNYRVAAGTDPSALGTVIVRVWADYVLGVESVRASGASLEWGVSAFSGTANIRLRYGSSRTSLDREVMLAADAEPGVGGTAELTGLDPATTYWAQLYVDSGSGYAAAGEMLEFSTSSLLPDLDGGKVISVGEPIVPGLNCGYITNVTTADISVNNPTIKWLPEPQLGLYAVLTNGATSTSAYPPVWGLNRTWIYSGYMYFDGTNYYQFGEAIDDATIMTIDGVTRLSDSSWNQWGKCNVKPTDVSEGWHYVEFKFYNGGSNGGISGGLTAEFSTDKDGLKCGFGWAKSATSVTPSNMKTLRWLCDPGDGSLLAAEEPKLGSLSINSFEIDEDQYDVSVSNCMNKATAVELYYGASPDVNALTNANNQLVRRFDLDPGEATTLHLDWESEDGTPPYYVIVFPEIGASDVQSFAASSRVAASVKSVGSDSAVVTVALGFDLEVAGDTPSATLTAYYGTVENGTTATGWDKTKELGTVEAGTYDFSLDGLAVGSTYFVRIAALDEGGGLVWSAPVSFSVSGVYLDGGIEVYENDPRTQRIAVRRSGSAADIAKATTVFLEYSGSGVSSVSSLPGSVAFGPGSEVTYVEFTATDNKRKDGDRSFTATLIPGSAYTAIAPLSAMVSILDDESADGEVVTWTGANGLDWADEGNWDKGHVPRSVDTARFADSGVTSGMSVNVASAEGVRQLLIETPLAFGLSGSGSLAVNRVERTDVEGVEEGDVTIGVPVVPGNADNGYSRWKVGGSGNIVLGGGLAASAGISLFKEGAGGLRLDAPDTAYAGPWTIYEGAVYANAANAIAGSLSIGAGNVPASLEALVENAVSPASEPTVYTNGTFVAKESDDSSLAPMRVNVYEGGVANLGSHFSGHQAHMTGGTVTGEMFCYGASTQRIKSYASSETAHFNCDYRIGAASNPLEITVENGIAPVDLEIGGRIYYGADALSGDYLTKFGTGTMRTTADWTGMSLGVEIAAGRVLVDNPTADGLGNQAVKVDKGASLGGTGFIGGTTASYDTSSAVTVEGEGNNEGEIAPGTIDAEGNHVIGTLTVGSAAKNGSVSFGEYTQFTVHIGPNGTCDRLQVNGTVSIADGVGTKIAIVCDAPAAAGGRYVVLRATGGISGRFLNVSAPLPGWKVVYTANEIAVEAPQPGRRVIIR